MSVEKDEIAKYGTYWPEHASDVEIEIKCIQKGGQWTKPNGDIAGMGNFHHYRELQSLLWPEDDHHTWSDLILREVLKNRITAVLGPKDSSKTHSMSKFGLCDYMCFPNETLILMSSTDLRGLELRVWGDVKDLFRRAKDRFAWLPGKAVDHLHGIFTDDLGGDDEIRNIRRGILCVPCIGSDNRWKGLGSLIGIKQKRRRLLADEMQLMEASYFDALANLNKGDFKGVFVGNPIGENDPLDKISEPLEGWDAHPEPTKTETWTNRFPEGMTINLVGSDSPNFHEPKNRYPYLVNEDDIEYIKKVWGPESYEMYNQALGIRKPGLDIAKVITRDMCRTFGAHENAIWANDNRTKIYAIDAAYGGDRCVAGWCEWGEDVNGKQVIRVRPPSIVPISVNAPQIPEDQIAAFIAQDCVQNGIAPSRVFHDSTGRGSLGTAISRIWSADTNPVEFGGSATERPVCSDLYVWDEKLQTRRLKRCDEHYEKFVTELWFSVRYAIEGQQIKELPQDVMDEGCSRKWVPGKNNRKCLEKKEDVKSRTGKSPDLFDWLSIIVEGARRLGFNIARLENKERQIAEDHAWKKHLRRQSEQLRRSYALDYKA